MNRYCGEQPSAEKAPRGRKTQDWIDKQHKQGWLNAAYWQDTFHIPPEMIEGALFESAKESRLGKTFKKAIAVEESFIPLTIYAGPADTKGREASGELVDWYKSEHIDLRGVVIGMARVDRCRPIFRDWGLRFTVRYDETVMSADQLRRALDLAIIGDFRPRFGRMRVTKFELQ